MPNDRIRQKLKAEGKSLRDIVRERNEAMAAYGYILAHIGKNVGLRTMYKLRDQYEKRERNTPPNIKTIFCREGGRSDRY